MKLKLRRPIVTMLEAIEEKIGINRKSVINLAIYHGILSIDNGFFPLIKKECQNTYKERINVDITEEMHEKLNAYLQMDEFKKINIAQLIEAFINMEFLRLCEEYPEYKNQPKDQSENQPEDNLEDQLEDNLEDQLEELRIHIKVNSFVKRKIDILSEYLGISPNQLYMYYFYIGCWENERKISPRTIKNDPILLEYIDSLGLNRIKAICLVNAVLHSKYNIIERSDRKD